MKKLLIAAVVVALALPALAWSASPYVSSIKDGTYKGDMTDKDGKKNPLTMEVKHVGDNLEATVKYSDGTEVWTWNDKTLLQKEVDKADLKKVNTQYGATADKPATANSQTFNVNCADKKANKCDADIDFRYSWTISADGSALKVVGVGVGKDKKADPTAKPETRFTIIANK